MRNIALAGEKACRSRCAGAAVFSLGGQIFVAGRLRGGPSRTVFRFGPTRVPGERHGDIRHPRVAAARSGSPNGATSDGEEPNSVPLTSSIAASMSGTR